MLPSALNSIGVVVVLVSDAVHEGLQAADRVLRPPSIDLIEKFYEQERVRRAWRQVVL